MKRFILSSMVLFALPTIIFVMNVRASVLARADAFDGTAQASQPEGSAPAGTQPAATSPANSQPAACNPETAREKVELKGVRYELDLATDAKAREIGLMERERLEPKTGMLFIYPREQVLSFWMKNCKMDIDVMFLDSRGTIVAIHEMKKESLREENEPLMEYEDRLKTYSSKRLAVFAIELSAGEAKQLGFKVGERVELDLKRLRSLAK